MPGTRLSGIAALGAALVLGGCYGSTEPATDVTVNSAQLNARGTADDGPAYSYFEFWPTADPSARRRTVERRWPAGASGPFRDAALKLSVAASYAYRVCGGDRDEPAACAQTRTFETVRPTGDVVFGTAFGGGPTPSPSNTARIDARSDASGANPTGTLQGVGAFQGNVTCLRVRGDRAAVGAVRDEGDGGGDSLLFEVIDGGDAAPDLVKQTSSSGATPPDCGAATFTGLVNPSYSEIVVYDAP